MGGVGDQEYLVPFRVVGVQDGRGVDAALFGQGVLVFGPPHFRVHLGQHAIQARDVEGLPDVDLYAPLEVQLFVVIRQVVEYFVPLQLFLLQLFNVDWHILFWDDLE